ncbi:MAG: hypothetical protein AAF654_12830 [Myxococcota bacterium]
MLGTWRGIGIFAGACLVVGIGFGSLFSGPGPKLVTFEEEPIPREPCDFGPEVDGNVCQGNGSSMTVLVPGHLECPVRVAGELVGRAPMFRAPVPTGRCSIDVRCGELRYCEVSILRASIHRELEIENDMWNARRSE